MNNFCKDCPQRRVPNILKEKYNQFVAKTFIECPFNDKQVVGCLIKDLNIKWEDFFKWIIQKEVLTDREKAILEREGWKISIGE